MLNIVWNSHQKINFGRKTFVTRPFVFAASPTWLLVPRKLRIGLGYIEGALLSNIKSEEGLFGVFI